MQESDSLQTSVLQKPLISGFEDVKLLLSKPVNELINSYVNEKELKNKALLFISEKGLLSEFEIWKKPK